MPVVFPILYAQPACHVKPGARDRVRLNASAKDWNAGFIRAATGVAACLFLSEDTVKAHLKYLFAKLGVQDRTEAAINALRQGIIQLE